MSFKYSQSVRVDKFTNPLLEVSDGASKQDDAVDWAEQIWCRSACSVEGTLMSPLERGRRGGRGSGPP